MFISAAFSCKLMSLRQALIDRRKYATASVNVGATKSFSKTNVMSNFQYESTTTLLGAA